MIFIYCGFIFIYFESLREPTEFLKRISQGPWEFLEAESVMLIKFEELSFHFKRRLRLAYYPFEKARLLIKFLNHIDQSSSWLFRKENGFAYITKKRLWKKISDAYTSCIFVTDDFRKDKKESSFPVQVSTQHQASLINEKEVVQWKF